MSVILINPFVFAGAANPSVTWTAGTTFTTSGSSHSGGNYNGMSIGAADSSRKIIAVVGWGSASDQTISSMTIGGVSATVVVNADTATSSGGLAIAIADVPTGTTADVAITFSGTVARSGVSLYRVINLTSSTIHASTTDTAATSGEVTGSLNVPANGFCIAGAVTVDGTAWTWSAGPTENYDVDIGSVSNGFSSALGEYVSAQTPLTVTATCGTGSRSALVAASWGN